MNAPVPKARKRKAGRPRVHKLRMMHGEYRARHFILESDGVKRKRWLPLGTTNHAIALAKNAEIIAKLERGEAVTPKVTAAPESFEFAARRICELTRKQGMKTIGTRERWLEIYAYPVLGSIPVFEVQPGQIYDCLEKALEKRGLSHQSLKHIRQAIRSVYQWYWVRSEIKENPCDRVQIPAHAPRDDRPRQILNDDQFRAFMACEQNSYMLRLLALTSRCLGGMRTSDLHAWEWSHINWEARTARIRRPKTRGKGTSWTLVVLPEPLLLALYEWWRRFRCPVGGFVFPLDADPAVQRVGISYARALRAGLRRAGVIQEDIHHSTEWSKRIDFHSFRRAYVTALGDAGVNAQDAMRLTGHTQISTHLGYVSPLRAVEAPAAALPALPAGAPIPESPGESGNNRPRGRQ